MLAGALLCFAGQPLSALPTMIRLGYSNCASCHIAPQGGGLLNPYGRGIDQAQSLVGGEYSPWQSPYAGTLNWGGRITQDVRMVVQEQNTSTDKKPGTQLFRDRFLYRNVTEFGKGFRFTGVFTTETEYAPRPSLGYDPPSAPSTLFANTALLSYRARNTMEFSVGRDQLPTGVNVSDLSFFIRSRNRLGYYDAPTQAKAFFWGNRYLINPYVYGPGGNEVKGSAEHGAGGLAEFDVLGKGRTVVGMNFLHGFAAVGDRTLIGPYMRLGFGKWGILAEHDITNRRLNFGTVRSPRQNASYGQVFWAVREWLVPSLIVERLQVTGPKQEHLDALRLDIAARLCSQLTISAGPRIQRDAITGAFSKAIIVQLAVKTVH
jgi:hypothetical protein